MTHLKKPAILFGLFGLIYALSQVFSGRLILPQFFRFGPFAVHYYGVIMAAAVLAGWFLAKKFANRYGIDSKTADDIIFWIIIGGFVGARIYHVLSSAGYYLEHPVDAFKIWQGGLSIYGAVFGGMAVILFLAKGYKLKAVSLLNWLTPSVILGQIIGRFGNLFNYEAYGYPTGLPWKMFVPVGFRPEAYQNEAFFHPWFFYEQVGLIIIFILIGKIEKPFFAKAAGDGSGSRNLFIYYLLLYNILRFGLEFLRADSTFIGQFRLNAIVSFGLVCLAAAALKFIGKIEHA